MPNHRAHSVPHKLFRRGAAHPTCALLLLALLLCLQGTARAETKAQTERLDGLSKADLALLAPELARGPVALIEFADMERDQLPAVNIAVPISASAEAVARVLSNPARFPRFMPTLDRVDIVAKHDNSVVYDWAFNLAILRMRGRNQMTIYPGRDRSTRVTIDSLDGDLGRGRMLFRVQPTGSNDSLLVVSLRLDLREANYIARQVAKAGRSVNRSANIALAFSMALRTQIEAERQEKRAHKQHESAPPHKPSVDLARIAPLLQRGDLLLFEARDATLEQVSVLGVVTRSNDTVQQVMRDAKGFGSSLVPGSKAEVISSKDAVTKFDWAIGLPLFGVSGQMRLLDEGQRLAIEATSGALTGGRWWFEATPLTPEATLVTGWAHFDFTNSVWLLEKLVAADAYLGHGIAGASELMLLRAIRSRAYKQKQ
ncbi:MAG TPA: SRPBCC family protein [Polyangiales bacterium]|nr:SRPBCC family protein [Polyangiales bacterium]